MAGYIGSKAVNLSTTGADINGDANIDGDLSFRDNDKIKLGAGSDLQIYHDGAASYVMDTGTGNLQLRGDNSVALRSYSTTDNYLVGNFNGSVDIYYDNSKKLATTSTGIDVTGTVTADGLTVDATSAISLVSDKTVTTPHTDYNLLLDNGSDTEFVIRLDSVFSGSVGSSHIKQISEGTNRGALVLATESGSGGVVPDRLKIDYNGDISFYEDTGTTAKLFWDASAESLGIGTSSPSVPLHINTSGTSMARFVGGNDGNLYITNDSANVVTLQAAGGDALSFNTNGGNERMRIDSSGNLLVGKTATSSDTAGITLNSNGAGWFTGDGIRPLLINRKTSDGDILEFRKDGATVGSIGTNGSTLYIGSTEGTDAYIGFGNNIVRPVTSAGASRDNAIDLGYTGMRFKNLYLSGTAYVDTAIEVHAGNSLKMQNVAGNGFATIQNAGAGTNTDLSFNTAGSEAMRIDSSGNLLVGKTSADNGATVGVELRGDISKLYVTDSASSPLIANRLASDGNIAVFQKDGTTVGSIGTKARTSSGRIFVGNSNTRLLFDNGVDAIIPANNDGNDRDNAIDLGASGARFDDIYATNGTIQTSDRNEKQDIAELTDAEQRVAVAAKGLLRKFRWRDAVVEKGDEARTHFGIIAQDLQAAFAAEGLDAGDYAMFISSTWTDEDTGEERTRMGVRYSELLAFIIGAL